MNMRKKTGFFVLIFAVIGGGGYSQNIYGALDTSNPYVQEYGADYVVLGVSPKASSEEIQGAYDKLASQYHLNTSKDPNAANTFKKVHEAYGRVYAAAIEKENAQAEKEAAEALAVESPVTEGDAAKTATSSGVGITSQIKSFISKIVSQVNAAFNKVKKAMGEAFTKMKAASKKTVALFKVQITNLQGQLKTVKEKATMLGKKLGAVVNALIKIVPMAKDTFDPSKEEEKENLAKIKKTIVEAKKIEVDPATIKTTDEKIKTAKEFFDTSKKMDTFLGAITALFTNGVPDVWKEQGDNAKDLDEVLKWMSLYRQHMNATKAILNAKEKKEEASAVEEKTSVGQDKLKAASEKVAVLEEEVTPEKLVEEVVVAEKEPSLVEQRIAEWEEKIAAE